eukprot:CAMPEP_0197691742 /NCGR_PEP_ID=MMETSP1338-20131121/110129_1 /TAXON_ID=43686 ORGANISM="Pelagodinium beii, Strain RCC1491" /NCGR_SAMPLE_ID=MMETSP1338 /ASSEMBLY_ACC=CAM_ASM_000754 /LENGTH=100 /DNA_ID=CAMNT_0043274327 /DNA_START=15 /DNA_END=314 /DNA_ORIENTATION=+
MGVLREGDVACVSLLELPWVMLPEGSYVRHAQMREGKCKLQKNGWMMSQHPEYGELLHPVAADHVHQLFREEAFEKLPVVKDKSRRKTSDSSDAVAERSS